MFKKTRGIVVLSCIFALIFSSSVFAKGGGGGGGGRSGGFSGGSRGISSSSSAFKSAGATQAKVATPALNTSTVAPKAVANAPTPAKTYIWTTKSTAGKAPAVAAERKGFGGTSLFDKKQTQVIKQDKAIKAKEAMTADTNKYTVKPQVYGSRDALPKDVSSNALYSQTRVRSTDNYNTFATNKNNYQSSHRFVPQPYMYSHSSYSGYDGMLFYMAMNNLSNVAMLSMMYNHSDQSGFKEWKAEATKQAETNAELKAQLAEMDAKLDTMTGEKNPKYLPPDMPADVALANDALVVAEKDTTEFTLGTGIKSGNYCKAGHMLKEDAKESINVSVVNTAGTMENLELFDAGKIDGFIGQKGGVDSYSLVNAGLVTKMKSRWVPLYKEPFHMVSNRDGSIKNITDLNESNTIYVGKRGSGTANSWNRVVAKNPAYGKVKVEFVDENIAIQKVGMSSKAVMLYVSGLNSSVITAAENRTRLKDSRLRLVNINDESLLEIKDIDGLPLYSSVVIPKTVYPSLQKGWFFKHKIKTISDDAVLVVSDKWVEENGEEALADLSEAVTIMQPKIYAAVNVGL